jgi:hypothetical protein
MNPNTAHNTNLDAIDRILATEEEMIPSSGFVAAAMERVREEAAAPEPIPFPWRRAIPGILLTAGVLGWGAFEAVRYAPAAVRELVLNPPQLSATAEQSLKGAGWVALALAAALCSWMLSVRLIRRSGLL